MLNIIRNCMTQMLYSSQSQVWKKNIYDISSVSNFYKNILKRMYLL